MTDVEAGPACENGGSDILARENGVGDGRDYESDTDQEQDLLPRVLNLELERISICSTDLKVDVKDLINIGNFEKARMVKPIKDEKPGYAFIMPYCQVLCVGAIVVSGICLVLGYKLYSDSEARAQKLKYAGFAMGSIGVVAFISVIYINSVSENNLLNSMRSFRKSKAANPQIAKKLAGNETDN